jgi:SAM-dependent methyltransferase
MLMGDLADDRRFPWRLLLPLDRSCRLLALGFDPEDVDRQLGQHVCSLHALEHFPLPSQTEDVLAPDSWGQPGESPNVRLPFDDGSIDVVVLQGIPIHGVPASTKRLTLAPYITRSKITVAAQNTLLTEVARVLSTDGCLLMSVQNRLSYERLVAIARRFFPRRRVARPPAKPYTDAAVRQVDTASALHSRGGYVRMMKKSGFSDPRIFSLARSRDLPSLRVVSALRGGGDFWRDHKADSRLAHLVDGLSLAPAYWIVASKEGSKKTSMLHDVLSDIGRQLKVTGTDDLKIRRFHVRAKNKVHLDITAQDRQLLVKIPLDTASLKGTLRNWRMLTVMQRRPEVPTARPLARGNVNGLHYFAESWLDSTSPKDQERPGDLFGLGAIEQLLDGINPDLETVKKNRLFGPQYDMLVRKPLEMMLTVVKDDVAANALRSLIHRRLYGLTYHPGFVHGDLSSGNIIQCGGRTLGLIDWELGLVRGIPVLDAIDHLLARQRIRERFDGRFFANTLLCLYEGKWSNEEELKFLKRQLVRSGISPTDIQALVLLYWIRYVTPQVEDGTIMRRGGVGNRVTSIMTAVLAA